MGPVSAASDTTVAEPVTASTEGVSTPEAHQQPVETSQPPPPSTLIISDPAPTTEVEVPEDGACASAGVESVRPPVTLLFALDASGSMIDNGSTPFRWDPVTVALKAFLGDPVSQGLNAVVQTFPKQLGLRDADRQLLMCKGETYAVPDVPATALPNIDVFGPFIDAIQPAGATPTTAVLEGLILQAEAITQSDPSARVATLLVSDGEPRSCRGGTNNVETAAATVAAVADRFPTYVIGVGDNLENLNRIAQAGGTNSALLVNVTDPTITRQTIIERLGEIRGSIASCDILIPEPPIGETLQPDQVTAKIQAPGVEDVLIPFEQDCATGTGFKYDNPADPSSITLCPQACSQLEDSAASVRILFGCALKPQALK